MGRQFRGFYLEQGLRLTQAAEPMRAEASEAGAGWPRPTHGIPGHGQPQDLAAVTGRADPGDRVHGQTDVAGIGQRRTAAMDADADAHTNVIRPGSTKITWLEGRSPTFDGAADVTFPQVGRPRVARRIEEAV